VSSQSSEKRKKKYASEKCVRPLLTDYAERDIPPKRQFLQDPQGATPQNIFFIVTAVKTSNPT
jgi:hypothetical protein